MLENKNKSNIKRREFLKKTVYSAPVLFALGQLVQPSSANADFSGGPEGPPDDFFDFSVNRRVDSNDYANKRQRGERPEK